MRAGIRVSMLCLVAAFLLLAHSGEAGVVSAGGDEYDPRRDPNYTRETLEKTPVNWQAVWVLVRESEARASFTVDRPQVLPTYAQPQPQHYVQGAPSPIGSPFLADASAYGNSYASVFYGYPPSFPGWYAASPRIPWWSLRPPRTLHGDRHHRWQGHHRRW
jgi:hypothetical protein